MQRVRMAAMFALAMSLFSGVSQCHASGSSPRPTGSGSSGTDRWAREAFAVFAEAGVRAAVPRGTTGKPLTRYQLAALSRDLFALVRRDMRQAELRWMDDPLLTWDAADPLHLRGERMEALLPWLVEHSRDPGAVQREARPLLAESGALRKRPACAFRDVIPSHPLYGTICQLADRGLLTGYPDGTFRGNQPATDGAFAWVLLRMSQEVNRVRNGRCYLRKSASPARPKDTGHPAQEATENP